MNAVLEAVAHMLSRLGFDGYTTDAIAESAGISIGSLFQYFPSRDAVTVALIEREIGLLFANVAELDSVANYQEAVNHLSVQL
jgi:AcrR family transcriptional regulator